jgi:hypothetical protein
VKWSPTVSETAILRALEREDARQAGEALKALDATPLERIETDGLWSPIGTRGEDRTVYSNEAVRLLISLRLAEAMPIGAIITQRGRDIVRRYLSL